MYNKWLDVSWSFKGGGPDLPKNGEEWHEIR